MTVGSKESPRRSSKAVVVIPNRLLLLHFDFIFCSLYAMDRKRFQLPDNSIPISQIPFRSEEGRLSPLRSTKVTSENGTRQDGRLAQDVRPICISIIAFLLLILFRIRSESGIPLTIFWIGVL